jgi:invasion protein IalB
MRKKRVICYISYKIELDLCKAMKYETAFNMIADNWSIPQDIISIPVLRVGFEQNS